MRRFSSIPLILLVTASFPALAQDKPVDINVRAAVQDGFVRLVFSGENLPQVDVTDVDKSHLKIVFAKAVAVKDAASAANGITPETAIAVDSPTALSVSVPAGVSRHRTLTLGSRTFVDIFTAVLPSKSDVPPAAPAATPAPAVKTEEAPKTTDSGIPPSPAASVVAEDLAAKPADVKTPAAPAATDTKPEEPSIPAPPEAALTAPTPQPVAPSTPVAAPVVAPKAFLGSAIVTVGSTQGIALAAFEREGYLWIVLSQENLSVPPVISGPDAAAMGPVDAVKIDGGSAYRIKLPEGAYVRPEGAGLIWRLYIEGKKTQLRSVTADRDFSNTADGPQVHIPINSASSVLRLPDPEIGDDLAVVTVGRADARLISNDKYVDFDILPAIVGVVLRPKADGMRVAVMPTEVLVARQGGLRISAAGPRTPLSQIDKPAEGDAAPVAGKSNEPAPTRIYNFADWSLGGPKKFLDSRRLLDGRVASADESQKLTELMSSAKFMLAQGLPQEGLGYLNMAMAFMPLLKDSADFQAIRGAMLALAGQTEDATAALATQGLETKDEIKLWQAYVLSQQGSFTEAQKLMPPTSKGLLIGYPERVQAIMLPPIIETVLSRGDVGLAGTLIDLYEKAADITIYPDSANAVAYFRGRLAQLRGDNDAATAAYREASDGYQGEYPVRATLALVERGLSAKTIAREDAVAKLERFRYAWRGDALESDMLQRLGLVYVTGGEQRRGLTILRDAATMASTDELREKLVAVMQKAFKELFSGKTKEKMTPLEAASVAAEFAELMPGGGDGEQITLNIADRMMAIDLLDRAADMIEPMVESTEKMADAMHYAQRAAAIRITDDRPDDALKIIDKALSRPDVQGLTALPPADLKSFALLRAKAKEQQKHIDDAFIELNSVPEDRDVLRLKADIAWESQRWALAADAFGKLVKMANLDATRPPTKEQAQMILNEALALNLAGKSDQLEALRIGYGDIMRRTELHQPFQLVTRTAREAKLADRGTLLKLVSEVNMFKDVLEGYKASENKAKSDAAAAKSSQTDQKDQKAEAPAAAPATDAKAKEPAADAAAPVEPGQEKKK